MLRTHLLRPVFAVAVAVLAAVTPACEDECEAESARIRVLSSVQGKPVPGAQVSLAEECCVGGVDAETKTCIGTTDGRGEVRIGSRGASECNAVVSAPGSATRTMVLDLRPGEYCGVLVVVFLNPEP